VTLFAERGHPTMTVSLADTLILEVDRFGADAALLQPVSPVQLNLHAEHADTSGDSVDQIVDEVVDEVTLEARRGLAEGDHVHGAYFYNHRDSESGSPLLTIQKTLTTVNRLDFDSRHRFGDRRQFDLSGFTNYSVQEQTSVADRHNFRFAPHLVWTHGERLRSSYDYTADLIRQTGADVTDQLGRVRLDYEHDERLSGDLEGRVGDTRTTNASRFAYRVGGRVTWRSPVRVGDFTATYRIAYGEDDQDSDTDVVNVVGEQLVLAGTTQVSLGRPNVETATVTVSNQTRTQVFTENVDYRLVQVGTETRVQRLVAGAILDGESVLADYSFRAGGTYDSSTLSNELNATLTFLRHFRVYGLLDDSDVSLLSGTPSVPLNSVRRIELGGRADVPFANGWSAGGEARYLDRHEDVSPARGHDFMAYVEAPLGRLAGSVRLSGHREYLDNLESTEDVDLERYVVALRTRPFARATFSADLTHEYDTGGSLDARRDTAGIRFVWRKRQLSFDVEARASRERQGGVERDSSYVRANLVRRF